MAKPLKKATINSLVQKIERVQIKAIKTHPENNNTRPDLDDIIDSLEETGLYKPLVVQKSSKHICAGNHTYLAARKMGWTEIDVVFVDVDDTGARRILLADNKTAQGAEIDDRLTAELLSKIPDAHVGTGFALDEVNDYLASLTEQIDSIVGDMETDVEKTLSENEKRRKAKTFEGAPLGEEDAIEDDEDAGAMAKQPDRLQDASSTMGALQFAPPGEMKFEGIGYFGIPRLKEDMLMTFDELPENLDSWGGSATKDWPEEDQWWLYNWAIDSTSGMRDISKVIVGFYCYDDYFENWWHTPERYIGKVINSGIKYIITPDFTLDSDEPRAYALWELYRSRWLGRYFQECGLRVIPNIGWRDGDQDFLEKYVLKTLPKGLPMVAIQLQTIDPDTVKGGLDQYVESINSVFRVLKPEGALLYASKQGRELFNDRIETGDTEVRVIGTRMEKLSQAAKGRKKKATI